MVGESLIGQLHAGLSRYALIPLYQAWLAQRGGSRPAWRAYSAGMAFRRSAMGWSDDQRREWQLRQLRRAVRDAERSTPYYAELFASVGFDPASDFDFADYAALPVLEREHIREAGDAIVTTAIPRAKLRRDATGGSTGQPTIVWRGPQDDGWSRSGTEFFTQAVGLRPGTGTAYLWGHHLDPRARASARERLQDWIENLRWYDCLRLSDETLLGYHRELQAWRPARMIAYAGALAALADVVGRLGDRPKYPTDGFVTGAEKLFGHQRARIREVFGRPVHERYGARDTGILGFQLDPERTLDYTIDWANVIVEPEESGGAASILVTKLHADGMPLLRYRIGDVGRFPSDARPGEPALRLHEVIGRDVSRLWLPDGRWANGLMFPHMLKDFPIRDFRVRQSPDFAIHIVVVPTEAFDGDARDSIVRIVSANLPGLPVELTTTDDIPRTASNKWNPVVSEVAAGRATQQPTASS